MTGTAAQMSLEETFIGLYDREAVAVLGYLRAATGHPQDAEDLAAETFLRAWRQLPSFQTTAAPPRHWLLRIAHNLVIDRGRRQARLRWQPLLDTAAPEGDSVDRLQLLAAVAELPDDDRELVALRAAGLTFAEVGAALGKSEGAAKMAWRRAAERLRPNLER
jgi:RNA polymerase sigma-70 factor (ECF subfamily)